ncbi:hypothetical protein MJA45_09315 [Paenibacillus aurantius]|uniref:Uncharacterized protein n=1 Tax=Paenibacillus aurantius TaxID=2918900 RepID=A0AA96LKS0_9BACL|nr:hypothetical protein [Paenibacillus aurantius]WNQ13202.1 hypothetical protein MJA45_09315 [Paenibacillus aurantius]
MSVRMDREGQHAKEDVRKESRTARLFWVYRKKIGVVMNKTEKTLVLSFKNTREEETS